MSCFVWKRTWKTFANEGKKLNNFFGNLNLSQIYFYGDLNLSFISFKVKVRWSLIHLYYEFYKRVRHTLDPFCLQTWIYFFWFKTAWKINWVTEKLHFWIEIVLNKLEKDNFQLKIKLQVSFHSKIQFFHTFSNWHTRKEIIFCFGLRFYGIQSDFPFQECKFQQHSPVFLKSIWVQRLIDVSDPYKFEKSHK